MSDLNVAVVGGGICGFGVGWKLAKAGVSVTVYERGEPMRESTWASAGMLAPQMELRPEEEAITVLGRECMTRWRRFAAEIEADSGVSVDYRDEGTLFVAMDRDGAEQLRFLHRHQLDMGLPVEWLSGDEMREREPYLSRRVVGGLYSPEDHQVEPRALGSALVKAFENAGGTLRGNATVEKVVIENGGAVGVLVGGKIVHADSVVIAAGAWSGMIDGLDGAKPPVRPVKGQMLSLKQPEPPILNHVVWAINAREFAYFGPKSDGRLLVGATVEEMGYEKSVTAGGVLELLRLGWEVVPGIAELPIIE
ncbi:MAG: glycine oxidase ThiO, partial [Candidatus Poribacteria bacterium]|nr:glycine oxidase ThiO [Candidatus Poribacteria bacterium]